MALCVTTSLIAGLLLGGIIGAVLWNCFLHAKANAHEGAWYDHY